MTTATLLAWWFLPGGALDRALFSFTAESFSKGPYLTSGEGTFAEPYAIRMKSAAKPTPVPDLAEILVTDDPDRVFQSSPPSPLDYAILLRNLRRLGRETVAIGLPLAWPEPDPLAFAALAQQLDELPRVITASPLTRGAVSTPVPSAFRRASVDISEVQGNVLQLPVVNRLSIPDVMLGDKHSHAGFMWLDSEPSDGMPHLLARWEDRVVFSFALASALADGGLSPSELKIRLGESISAPGKNLFVPIDEFGRLASAPAPAAGEGAIPAEALIDAPEGFLDGLRPGLILLRDDRSASDESLHLYSGSLASLTSHLASSPKAYETRMFRRAGWGIELLFLASLLSLIGGMMQGFPHLRFLEGRLPLALLALLILNFHLYLTPAFGVWLPILPVLVAFAVAIPLTSHKRSGPSPQKGNPPP